MKHYLNLLCKFMNKLIMKIILKFEGGEVMIALMLANRCILGTKGFTFDQVPNSLKADVARELKEVGCDFLINVEEYK